MTKLLKFVIGGLMAAGSFIFGIGLIFSFPFAAMADSVGSIVVAGVITFIIFLVGIFLMRS